MRTGSLRVTGGLPRASAEIAPAGFHLGELLHQQLNDVLSLTIVQPPRSNEVLKLLKSHFQEKGLKVAKSLNRECGCLVSDTSI
jgi:hypothetical protein